MTSRIPVVATILVLIAIGVMVRLGFWQLDRMQQKEALLADYAAASEEPAVAWPADRRQARDALYRRSSFDCAEVIDLTTMAGSSAQGQSGLAQVATCRLPDGATARVVLGWSRDPVPRSWRGGEVGGIIAPGGREGPRLVADPPLAGLEANALPDPRNIPNNHLSYAVQWFLFAVTALVIYVLAVRKRLAGTAGRG